MNKEILKKIWNVVFYALLIGVVALFVKRKFIVPQVASEDLQFVDFQTNEIINVSDYKDKVVVVNFWQTWCGPCIQEMPSFNEMTSIWDDFIVFCVTDEASEKVKAYILKYPNIHFVAVDNVGEFGITQYPTTYIYNKKGIKVFSKIGSKDWSDPNFIATIKNNWD